MAATILLAPLKILLKAVGAAFTAELGIIAFFVLLASKLTEKLAAFAGGLILIVSVVLAILKYISVTTALIGIGVAIAIIAATLIVSLIGQGIIALRNVIKDGLNDIEII